MDSKCLYVWVWYGEKAKYQEKQLWNTARKILGFSGECDENFIEVKSKTALDELESDLLQSGWVVDTSNPTTLDGRLKIWKRDDSSIAELTNDA